VGSLAIGAGPFAAEISVAKAIARVVGAHPRLQIKFTVVEPEQVAEDVLAGRIDVGVASTVGLESDARLAAEPLPPLRVYLACRPGHPLTKETRPTLARALEFPLATTSLRGALALLASSAGAATLRGGPGLASFIPQIVVNSLAHARLIARDSDALFTGTAALLAEDLAAGRLVKLDCHVPEMRTTYGVLYLRGRTLAPAAKSFIETLRAVEVEAARTDVISSPPAKSATSRRQRASARR